MTNKKLNGISQVMENEVSVKQLNAVKNGTVELSEKNLEEIAGGYKIIPKWKKLRKSHQ